MSIELENMRRAIRDLSASCESVCAERDELREEVLAARSWQAVMVDVTGAAKAEHDKALDVLRRCRSRLLKMGVQDDGLFDDIEAVAG